MKPWTSSVGIAFMAWIAMNSSGNCPATRADSPPPQPFDVKTEVVHRELSSEFCWFHPRVAAIPDAGIFRVRTATTDMAGPGKGGKG